MPTTCGFPNCKFRSRYRGADDNRHFYRVPKKPTILRMKWLEAIGRTEETIVSQLRVCSGHFHGGEKKEGDVPVSDPAIDKAIKVELPPKTIRSSSNFKRNKRRLKSVNQGMLSTLKQFQTNGNNLTTTGTNIPSCIPPPPMFLNPQFSSLFQQLTNNCLTNNVNSFGSFLKGFSPLLKLQYSLNHSPSFPFQDGCNERQQKLSNFTKSNVVVLDSSPMTVDETILGNVCDIAYLTTASIPSQAITESNPVIKATAVICEYFRDRNITSKFSSLKHAIKIGPCLSKDEIQLATEMNVALSVISAPCVDEIADTILSLILSLHRHTSFLTGHTIESKHLFNWSRNKHVRPVKGQILGIIGLGPVGVAVALRARVFGFQIKFFDPTLATGSEWYLGMKRVESLYQLLSESDCITVNVDYSCDFSSQIAPNWYEFLKKGTYFVNISPIPMMKLTQVSFGTFNHLVDSAAISVSNIEEIVVEELIETKAKKYLIMPDKMEFSRQCLEELRENALLELKRGIWTSSLDSLRCCVNKTELIQKNRTNLEQQNLKAHSNTPDSDFSKIFSVESLILNNKTNEGSPQNDSQ